MAEENQGLNRGRGRAPRRVNRSNGQQPLGQRRRQRLDISPAPQRQGRRVRRRANRSRVALDLETNFTKALYTADSRTIKQAAEQIPSANTDFSHYRVSSFFYHWYGTDIISHLIAQRKFKTLSWLIDNKLLTANCFNHKWLELPRVKQRYFDKLIAFTFGALVETYPIDLPKRELLLSPMLEQVLLALFNSFPVGKVTYYFTGLLQDELATTANPEVENLIFLNCLNSEAKKIALLNSFGHVFSTDLYVNQSMSSAQQCSMASAKKRVSIKLIRKLLHANPGLLARYLAPSYGKVISDPYKRFLAPLLMPDNISQLIDQQSIALVVARATHSRNVQETYFTSPLYQLRFSVLPIVQRIQATRKWIQQAFTQVLLAARSRETSPAMARVPKPIWAHVALHTKPDNLWPEEWVLHLRHAVLPMFGIAVTPARARVVPEGQLLNLATNPTRKTMS